MTIDLSSTNILITGSSRGIGSAMARHLGEAGATLALHYNQNKAGVEKLIAGLSGTHHLIQANLKDPEETQQLFDTAVKRLGRIDVLINNAAVSLNMPLDATEATWLRDWETTIQVNLRATEQLSRNAIRHFISIGGGRIINIASRAAFRGDTPDFMTYAVSKGGLVALTRSIARGFGKQNIKAFVIAPGFTRTDMAQDFIDAYGEEYITSDLALNRVTEPDDIAPMVVLLASGLADHATGCTIDINAGSYVH